METNKRLFRFLTYDQLKGLSAFWIIIVLVNIAALIFTSKASANVVLGPMIRNGEAITFAGANIFSLFVYFIIYGLLMYHESFSLTAGFGVTRKDFYLNVIVNNIIIVSISSIIEIILLKIDNYAISMIGYKPMVDFGLFNTNDYIAVNILKLSLIFLIFASTMNLLGILQYRFGYKLWIGISIFTVFTSLTINPFNRFVGEIIRIFIDANNLGTYGSALVIGLLIILLAYSIGYLLIRRIDVK